MSGIRKQGVVKKYDKERAFGWVQEEDGRRHFLHLRECVDFVPSDGVEVTFVIGPGRKGMAACDVRKVLSPLEQAAADLVAATTKAAQ
jgi:cold shock CspA family protein